MGRHNIPIRLLPACVMMISAAAIAAFGQTASPTKALSLPTSVVQVKSKAAHEAATLKSFELAPVDIATLAKTIRPAAKAAKPAASNPDLGVMELRAVSPQPSKLAGAARSRDQPWLKNVHGEVSGAIAPGVGEGREANVAAGASSKSGKIHIFIEADHAQAPVPR